MRKSFNILLVCLLLPLTMLAQDTIPVKKSANEMAQAMTTGDYKLMADYTYPEIVKAVGGKEKMLNMLTSSMQGMNAQGISFESVTMGPVGKFYNAGTQLHCLVPYKIRMKLPNGHATINSYLLGVSSDAGKTWTFVDINNKSDKEVSQLFPHFNPDLKIPAPTPPVMEQ